MTAGIINYGGGNLRSVVNAVKHLGIDPLLLDKPSDLEKVSHVIFPGQGAFGQCSTQVQELGLFDEMRQWISDEKPFFGICIGYQLLFETSEESVDDKGLSVFKGQVRRFPDNHNLKIPHMGWNALSLKDPKDPMWKGLSENPYFYFVHSYYPTNTLDNEVAATCSYGEKFVAAVKRGQTWGCQFHPEKSQHAGIQLLKNFFQHTE